MSRLSPEIIDTYRQLKRLCVTEDSDACIALNGRLHALLGRKAWQETVMDTIDIETLPDFIGSAGPHKIEDWLDARALRRELEVAIALKRS